MKLYYIPTTRAVRPRWLLEEMGVPYELIRVNKTMTQQPKSRKQALISKEELSNAIATALTLFSLSCELFLLF
jgi:hypothetical protein